MTVGIVISRQRSGTSALGSALHNCPGIRNCGEVLYRPAAVHSVDHFFSWIEAAGRQPVYQMEWCQAFQDYLDDLQARSELYSLDLKINTLGAFSPEIWGTLWRPWILHVVMARAIPIVWLKRRDRFRTYFSGKYAEKRNSWHQFSTRGDQSKEEQVKIVIDRADYLGTVRMWESEDLALSQVFQEYNRLLVIHYENLFRDGTLNNAVFRTVVKFFGREEIKGIGRPNLERIVTSDLRNFISNFDEIEDLLEFP